MISLLSSTLLGAFRTTATTHFFKEKSNHPVTVIERALALKIFYEQVKSTNIPTRKRCAWDPPPPGNTKLNVDRAIFFNSERARVGCILRDSQRDLIMVVSSLETFAKPETIEALAILCGLQLSIHLGFPISLLRAIVYC